MYLTNLVLFLLSAIVFIAEAKKVQQINVSAKVTEDIIKKEIDRLAPLLDEIEKSNLNITVVFSRSKFDEESETLVQYDAVELRPLSSKYNPDGPQLPNEIGVGELKEISKFANNLNLSAIASREVFSEDGSLYSKDVYIQNLKVSYKDGVSHVIIKDIAGKMREKEFEDFVNMMKDYELPVEVHKTLYSEKGEVLKTDSTEYKPNKVRIVDADMQISRQLKVAEALKRACVMKEEGNDRMLLLSKYLGMQYPKFGWQAVMGNGDHFIYSNEWVKLNFEDQTYLIWSNKK